MKGRPVEEIADHLISSDPFMAGYRALPEDLRSRERFFIENSIEGFLEYLSGTQPPNTA